MVQVLKSLHDLPAEVRENKLMIMNDNVQGVDSHELQSSSAEMWNRSAEGVEPRGGWGIIIMIYSHQEMHIKSTNISLSSADNKEQLRTPSLTNNNSSKSNIEVLCRVEKRYVS